MRTAIELPMLLPGFPKKPGCLFEKSQNPNNGVLAHLTGPEQILARHYDTNYKGV
jgi:hypothetical protein